MCDKLQTSSPSLHLLVVKPGKILASQQIAKQRDILPFKMSIHLCRSQLSSLYCISPSTHSTKPPTIVPSDLGRRVLLLKNNLTQIRKGCSANGQVLVELFGNDRLDSYKVYFEWRLRLLVEK